jgi:hypothetical protein
MRSSFTQTPTPPTGAAEAIGKFLSGLSGMPEQAAEKVHDGGGGAPQALKRWFIFNRLTARVKLVPFPFLTNPEFFRSL